MIHNTLTEAVQSGYLTEIREHLAAGADPNVLLVDLVAILAQEGHAQTVQLHTWATLRLIAEYLNQRGH